MTRFERWSLWATTLAATLSGIGYGWTRYLMQSGDPFSIINHPLQPYLLKVHIVTSPLLIYALGLVTIKHVWKHYRSGVRTARRSGIAVAALAFPMITTGYLIQVFTGVAALRALSVAHIATGLLYAVGFVAHLMVLRVRRHGARRGGESMVSSSTASTIARKSIVAAAAIDSEPGESEYASVHEEAGDERFSRTSTV